VFCDGGFVLLPCLCCMDFVFVLRDSLNCCVHSFFVIPFYVSCVFVSCSFLITSNEQFLALFSKCLAFCSQSSFSSVLPSLSHMPSASHLVWKVNRMSQRAAARRNFKP
jgi:hypothetical protein